MMKVAKWGNSLAVRLPAAEVVRLGLVEGDEVDLDIHLKREADLIAQRRVALEALRELRGLIPADFKFDREEANARR
jgi:antitoxin MazE